MWTLLPLSLLCLLDVTLADPVLIPFQDCSNQPGSLGKKFNVSTVYAQVLQNADLGNYLNLTVFGTSPQPILGLVNTSLATLFTSTSVLTLDIWSNSSYLCQNLRPPSPLPTLNSTDGTFCPVDAGPFAFSSTIPWGNNRELTTLITQLRAVDPFGNDLVCLNLFTTPLDPQPHSLYGKAVIIFWSTVALTIAYWVVIGIARIASAWNRGITRPGRGIWSRAQSAGFILASAVSGEHLATSPALMHFCTPSMRDVIFHTQWCALLATVAVEWPQFVYPLLTQPAWSTLLYNISLSASKGPHWNPLATPAFSPPSDFSDQVNDPTSPLFIEPDVPNVIYNLPSNATNGMSSFAYTLGIRPQDLFPTCMILFLGIIAGTIAMSFLVSLLDYLVCLLGDMISGSQGQHPSMSRLAISRSPIYEGKKELSDNRSTGPVEEENKALQGPSSVTTGKFSTARFGLPLSSGSVGSERGINSHRPWWRIHSDSFHMSVLHGNLVRILVLFHLPVTVFSCYQMSLRRALIGTGPVALASLSFLIFSILIPAHLVIRVTFTTTNKLYDETRTLLSLGPLYNHYRHGSQLFASLFFATNIVFGVTIGVGQKSGTAQAIIILVVEVVSALVTSIWLPWGSGASMGLISFLFCVARIVIAVLLLILTPAVSIGPGPGGWVAYGILVILALVYLALLLMLLGKIIEGLVRMFGGIGFDRSKHMVDTGILGAFGLLGCGGSRKKRRSRSSRKHKRQPRNSDLSSFLPPVGGAIHNAGTVTPRMGSQPPSVLKPEHANRPYREEHNDDDGYIMGAWRPSPRTSMGYIPVSDGPQTSLPENFVLQPPQKPKLSMSSSVGSTTTPGFSRIGGGRAHIDSPYAITTGSTHTFPSVGHQSQKQLSLNQSTSALPGQLLNYERSMEDNEDDPPLSLSNVESGMALGNDGLPLGSTLESHIRTKSQSAIVENYLPIVSGSGSGPSSAKQYQSFKAPVRQLSQDNFLQLPEGGFSKNKFTFGGVSDPDDDDSGDEQDQQKKHKKPWYHLRRPRLHSTEEPSASPTDLGDREYPDGEMGELDSSEPKQQRSFVVIRKPTSSMGRLTQPSSSASVTFPMDASRPPTR